MINYKSRKETQKFIDKELRSLSVIISLCSNPVVIDIDNPRSLFIAAHYHLPIKDHENECFIVFFENLCEIINKHLSENINVIMHCNEGISRSPTLIIAYMIFKEKISYGEAHTRLNDLMVSINDGFIEQLRLWEEHIINDKILVIDKNDYISPQVSLQYLR